VSEKAKPCCAEVDLRLLRVETRVDKLKYDIDKMNDSVEEAREAAGMNYEILESIQSRLDEQGKDILKVSDVESIVTRLVPGMVSQGIESSIGKWATRIIVWVSASAGLIIVNNAMHHWL